MISVEKIIENGEDSFTEFKSEEFHNDSLAKEVVAFSNMQGGSIFIGVDDTGKVLGVSDHKLEERIINICRNLVEPSVLPQIKKHSINDKKIIELIIPKGNFKPYKVKSHNRIYIRVGSVAIEPSVPELIRLLQSGGQFHFEVSGVPQTSINDFDTLRFREYCKNYRYTEFNSDLVETLAQNFQLMTTDKTITVAGMLFFASNIEVKLVQAGVQLIRFVGNDKSTDILDQKEYTSVIQESVEKAVQFVETYSAVRGVFSEQSHLRKDIQDYDSFAVRELITNAFCHRDWSIVGQKIRVFLFSDYLEIFSPGGLPNTMSLNNALAGVSYYRNPIIAQICKDYGIIEKAGRGLESIMKRCKQFNLPTPEFTIEPEFVKVRLKKNTRG